MPFPNCMFYLSVHVGRRKVCGNEIGDTELSSADFTDRDSNERSQDLRSYQLTLGGGHCGPQPYSTVATVSSTVSGAPHCVLFGKVAAGKLVSVSPTSGVPSSAAATLFPSQAPTRLSPPPTTIRAGLGQTHAGSWSVNGCSRNASDACRGHLDPTVPTKFG